MAMCLHGDVNEAVPGEHAAPQSADDALDVGRGDLRRGEADDAPAGEECFEVFLGVRDETCGAIVPAAAREVDAALDLDERAALEVREVRAPLPLRMKDELALQLRPAQPAPVEREFRFKA